MKIAAMGGLKKLLKLVKDQLLEPPPQLPQLPQLTQQEEKTQQQHQEHQEHQEQQEQQEHQEHQEQQEQQEQQEEDHIGSTPTILNSTIALRIKDRDGDETFFKVKMSTKMSKLFGALAQRKGIDIASLVFTIDGDIIHPYDTPASLELEDQDQIDVEDVKTKKKTKKKTVDEAKKKAKKKEKQQMWKWLSALEGNISLPGFSEAFMSMMCA